MADKMYAVFLEVRIPINVVVTASSKKAAKETASEMYYEGVLNDRVFTSMDEHNDIIACTKVEQV